MSTITIDFRKVSQWLSKTIIPIAIGIGSIILAYVLAKPELLGGAAAFITPILEYLQKAAKDELASEKSNQDAQTAFAAKLTSDASQAIISDISAEAQAAYKPEAK